MRARVLGSLWLFLSSSCGSVAPIPASQPPGSCASRDDCGRDDMCLPPGEPACGGAEWDPNPPLGGCPADRPHWVDEGCHSSCAAEPAVVCEADSECPPLARCEPTASGADAHGCVRRPCQRDGECGPGRCVERRCYEGLGVCVPMPV